MSNLISDMTKQQIEDDYQYTADLISDRQHSYKDIMYLDQLENEIYKRNYRWSGCELLEEDE